MIPPIIHYCWFGGKEIPANLRAYMESWHRFMPGWEIMRWDEASLTQTISPHLGKEECWLDIMPLYVRQAYEARKFAFVSDYVRLWALEQYGGVYLDTDVEVIRSFEELSEFRPGDGELRNNAFIGFEESLAHLPGTCVMGCKAHCKWVKDMLVTYEGAEFVNADGSYDLTTNVQRMGKAMVIGGLVPNGREQYIEKWGLHVYDHHYFSPMTSTHVMRKNKNTYAIHHFAGTWRNGTGWLGVVRRSVLVCEIINALIQIKRFFVRIEKKIYGKM